ncbi:MAG: phage head-tail joining protein [Janthinobacterium lividum]
MAYTDADLTNLRAAITSGIRTIRFADGRETQYQSLDHMLAAERVISAEVALADRATSGVTRRRFAVFGSGL